MKLSNLTPIALATLMCSPAFATDPVQNALEGTGDSGDKDWHLDASLGVIITTGNNETTTLKGKLELFKDYEQFDTKYVLDGFYKEDEVIFDDGEQKEKQKTAEKYLASALGNYKLEREGSSLFAFLSHETDKFGAYENVSSVAAGYGHQLYKSEVALLKGYIGPGYVWRELSDGTDDDSAVLHATADYEYKFNEFVEFSQALSFAPSFEGEKNITTKSITGLSAKMNSKFKMKFELIATHNSEVPDEDEKLDTETVVTLVYSF